MKEITNVLIHCITISLYPFLAREAVAGRHQDWRDEVLASEVSGDHEEIVGGGAWQQSREELRVEGFHGAEVDDVNDDQERGDDDCRGRQLVCDTPSEKLRFRLQNISFKQLLAKWRSSVYCFASP